MNERTQKSILQMARGAIQERADYEMSRLLDNILDPNTAATAQRTLTITLKLKPDDTRQNIAVSCVAKSTLAATNPVTTSLYVADEETIVEMVPQIPGQMTMDGQDQEAPPLLKLIKTAGYQVVSVEKVLETDTSGTATTSDNRITLFTCVRDQRAYRWCVQAVEC